MDSFNDYLASKGKFENQQSPLYSPSTVYYKKDGTPLSIIMAWHPERLQTFQANVADIDVAILVTGHYDLEYLKNASEGDVKGLVELVDVGGSQGEVLHKHWRHTLTLCPRIACYRDAQGLFGLLGARGNSLKVSSLSNTSHGRTVHQR